MPTLDGWRAIAILAVLVDHACEYAPHLVSSKFSGLVRIGPNGVSLFFAISGFLICSRLLEEDRANGKISLSGFYIRRACRILPPALLYLAVLAALGSIHTILVTQRELWSSVFFFRNYLPPAAISKGWGGYTVHYWSLAVEEHFYLLWPALLVLVGKRRATWVALSLAASVALWRSLDLHYQWFARFVPGLLFGSRTDVRLDGLLLGCVVALILDGPEHRRKFSSCLRPRVWLILVGLYCAIQVFYLLEKGRTYSLVESALIPAIVAGTVYGRNIPFSRLLEAGPMKMIGRLSYSLYLWQQLFCLPEAQGRFVFLQKVPFNIPMIFLCAWLSYTFVERPFIRLGHRFFPPPTEGREDLRAG